ncbi:unnamed protein product, partial [Mesorhabditis belari]|uniref:Cysteine rich secreted protein n=1 Tax=Mesorhabditis belari TaxID=2138241 RepID=A0AAF3FR37_9BILA
MKFFLSLALALAIFGFINAQLLPPVTPSTSTVPRFCFNAKQCPMGYQCCTPNRPPCQPGRLCPLNLILLSGRCQVSCGCNEETVNNDVQG